MINKELVRSRFEKSIQTYDKTAIVQKNMAEELAEKICQHCGKNFSDIFEFGSGTGFLTNCLAGKLNFSKYYANDIVEKSKGFVQNILPDSSFIPGDIETIELSTEFDLIVSNASMQWICDIDTLFNKLKSALKPDGVLAFTTFGEKNYREIKETTGLALNYLKTDTLAQLCEKYFKMEYLEEKTETLLFDSPMDILKHIKDSGTNGIQTINWTVKKLRDFERFYTLKFNENEKVRLTYNPIYVILKNNK